MTFYCRYCGKTNDSFRCLCIKDEKIWDRKMRKEKKKNGKN